MQNSWKWTGFWVTPHSSPALEATQPRWRLNIQPSQSTSLSAALWMKTANEKAIKHISVRTIDARWCLISAPGGSLHYPIRTQKKKRAFRRTGQTRPCCPGLHSACWGPRSPRLTLLLFAAVDGKFYEARLSFTTNPNERRPEERGAKRKRKTEGLIAKNDLDGM